MLGFAWGYNFRLEVIEFLFNFFPFNYFFLILNQVGPHHVETDEYGIEERLVHDREEEKVTGEARP